ncbi:MAG: SPFH/Band 7/PHB domain protein, partial [Acidobacteriota bacterium]|nr:SPFH/Band 7/PHB domain protein [Acidobacteriota bacterium]
MNGLLIIIAIALLVIVSKGATIIRPYQRGVVERLGKYQRTVSSGLTIIVPFLEKIIKVDMREQVVDVPPQAVITKDNVAVEVDAVVYYEVTDPVKVLYNISNFYMAATKLAQTNLRNLIGDLALDESLTSRETINKSLQAVLDDATDKWGARVKRVELQRIEPPADVTAAMHRQMKAERERRAVILEAEGAKTSAILKAEGQKQSQILEAEGQKLSNILEAEGQAEAIKRVAEADKYQKLTVAQGEASAVETVFGAIHNGNPTNDLIAIKYLEALQKIADGKATKIFLPL